VGDAPANGRFHKDVLSCIPCIGTYLDFCVNGFVKVKRRSPIMIDRDRGNSGRRVPGVSMAFNAMNLDFLFLQTMFMESLQRLLIINLKNMRVNVDIRISNCKRIVSRIITCGIS